MVTSGRGADASKGQDYSRLVGASGIDACEVEARLVSQFVKSNQQTFWNQFGWIALFYRLRAGKARIDEETQKERRADYAAKLNKIDAVIKALDIPPAMNLDFLSPKFYETGIPYTTASFCLELRKYLFETKECFQRALDATTVHRGPPRQLPSLPFLVRQLRDLYTLVVSEQFHVSYDPKKPGLDAFTKEGGRFVAEAVTLIEPNATPAQINTAIKSAEYEARTSAQPSAKNR